MLCRSLPPPGLWKCHAVSVAMHTVTLECCKRKEGGNRGMAKTREKGNERMGFYFLNIGRAADCAKLAVFSNYCQKDKTREDGQI